MVAVRVPTRLTRAAQSCIDARMAAPYAFWDQVDKTGDCWLWRGRVSQQGAMFTLHGRTTRVARVACQLLNIDITDARIFLTCGARLCVNPAHMKLGKQCGASVLTRVQAAPKNSYANADAWFWPRVDRSKECWPWRGPWDINGYGNVQYAGYWQKAHRVAYQLAVGRIPAGLCVLHACDNPPCVNPAHLWCGTKKQNTQDMMLKRRNSAEAHPGETNGRAKLTDDQVRAIRVEYPAAGSYREMAAAYNVSPAMIRFIVIRKNWTHI